MPGAEILKLESKLGITNWRLGKLRPVQDHLIKDLVHGRNGLTPSKYIIYDVLKATAISKLQYILLFRKL
jgi:hypothetical protein